MKNLIPLLAAALLLAACDSKPASQNSAAKPPAPQAAGPGTAEILAAGGLPENSKVWPKLDWNGIPAFVAEHTEAAEDRAIWLRIVTQGPDGKLKSYGRATIPGTEDPVIKQLGPPFAGEEGGNIEIHDLRLMNADSDPAQELVLLTRWTNSGGHTRYEVRIIDDLAHANGQTLEQPSTSHFDFDPRGESYYKTLDVVEAEFRKMNAAAK